MTRKRSLQTQGCRLNLRLKVERRRHIVLCAVSVLVQVITGFSFLIAGASARVSQLDGFAISVAHSVLLLLPCLLIRGIAVLGS